VLGGAVAAIAAAVRLCWRRLVYIARASEAARQRYGDDPEAVVDFWFARQQTIAIHEIRQRLLESAIGAAIYVCDLQGQCESVNEELAELFGIDKADCVGLGWLEGICPEDRKRVHDVWMFCVTAGIPYECEYIVHNKRTGAEVEVTTKAYPVKRFDGKMLCYVGSVTRAEGSQEESQ